MNKLVVAVALALCCASVANADKFAAELVQNFQKCNARFPPALAHDDLQFLTSNTRWYLKYMDEIYFSRISDIFLTGSENRPVKDVRNFFDSPCLVNVNDPYVAGVQVKENYTSGTLGLTTDLLTTLTPSGLVTNTIFFPNGNTPAVSTNWVPVLTNGRSFILQYSCLPEGHLGFQVFTTIPELDAYSKHQITQYLEHSGFPDNLSTVTTYRASTCTNQP